MAPFNPSPFDRYPGKKAPNRYPLFDDQHYDAAIEPFAGSAVFSLTLAHRQGLEAIYLADSDSSIRAVYQTWLNPELHDRFYSHLRSFQDSFYTPPSLPLLSLLDPENDESITDDIEVRYRASWSELKRIFDEDDRDDPAKLAAASLAIRKLTFAGVIRCNTEGGLNVKDVACQIPSFCRWQFRFPALPKAKITIAATWQECLNQAELSGLSAVTLIDPPYYVPFTEDDKELSAKRRQTGLMSPCYRHHAPHDDSTLEMCVEATQRVLGIAGVKRAIVTNYFSQKLHDRLLEIAPFQHRLKGRLDGVNKSRASTTNNLEAVWEYSKEVQSNRLIA